jgi:arginine/lysine/ornithine decarboxylase
MGISHGRHSWPDKRQMPLVSALLQLSDDDRSPWHMPAHRSGRDWPDWLKSSLASFDVTELPLTDDINRPSGPALHAMQLAAAAFGAGRTRFITSGSTTAMQIMLAATVGREGTLLLPRTVHQSVVNTAALLDFKLIWLNTEDLPSDVEPFGLMSQPTADAVSKALQKHRDCQVVLLTSPDYYGFCPDLAKIAEAVHREGAILLVDEAHGAHLAFGDNLPPSAMQAGADACVQSGHKTLPVMTPGSYFHIAQTAIDAGRFDINRLDAAVPVFQTSSPSFAVAATLDYARAWLSASGGKAIQQQLDYLDRFADSVPKSIACSPRQARVGANGFVFHDPLRLVLTGEPNGPPLDARRMASLLEACRIDIEFADLTRLVLIPALAQPESQWHELAAALTKAKAELALKTDPGLAELDNEWRQMLQSIPEAAASAAEALLGKSRRCQVPLDAAAGRISVSPILPYPPGIPLVWPGERLDQRRVDFLRRLLENNINISGINQGCLWVLA